MESTAEAAGGDKPAPLGEYYMNVIFTTWQGAQSACKLSDWHKDLVQVNKVICKCHQLSYFLSETYEASLVVCWSDNERVQSK